jgi:hypothetical protein
MLRTEKTHQWGEGNPIKKGQMTQIDISQEDIQTANKSMKKMSVSLIMKEMHKTIIRYHLTPVPMVVIKRQKKEKKNWVRDVFGIQHV